MVEQQRHSKANKEELRSSHELARMRVPLGFFCAGAVLCLARPDAAIARDRRRDRARRRVGAHLGRRPSRKGARGDAVGAVPDYPASSVCRVCRYRDGRRGGVGARQRDALIGAYMAITILAAVRHEEANMRASFGDGYDAYLESRAARVERAFSLARAIEG